ncbi:MAG: signal peptide peptidase SppA [Caldiserica bacterium]|nr:signal peptide peptidase SppA [Caldisericota bacterium]
MHREQILSLLIILLLLGSIVVGVFYLPTPAPSLYSTRPSFPVKEEGNIAIIEIYGPIQIEPPAPFRFTPQGSDYVVSRLRELSNIKTLKAVILRINSPGGTVAAVQEIYQEIERLKKQGIKVVASMGDIATSGAYYIASACDVIVADPGTLTGSIGVIIPLMNFQGLMQKLGIKAESIKSGKYKDIGSSSKEMTPEEREILQQLVDNAYQQFLSAVKKGRGSKVKGKWENIADGRIFTGEQAYKLGLVDYLGNFEEAKKIAKDLAGIKGKPVFIRERKGWQRFFELREDALFNWKYYLKKDPLPYYLPLFRKP